MTMSWLLLELARNPEIQDRVLTEMEAIQSEPLDIDALDSLPYLDACIKETLRYSARPYNRLAVIVFLE